MRKILLLTVGLLVLVLFAGCAKDRYEGMTAAPDIDSSEVPKENPMEDMVAVDKPEKPLVLDEGCFYEKTLTTYTKAGIIFYFLQFKDQQGTVGYNLTSKTDTTLKKIMGEDVGICIYQDKWQYFNRNGSLWSLRMYEEN